MMKIRIMLIALLALGGSIGHARGTLASTNMLALYNEGNRLFHEADELVGARPEEARELYQRAAIRFERIAREGGIENGKLFYNIGNAYFRMGDIGRAILYYRRAEQFAPNDPNLRQNLKYARANRLDKVEEQQKTRVLKILFFWHYDLSSRTRSLLFVVIFGAVWVFALCRLLRRRGVLTWLTALSACVACALFASLVAEAYCCRTQKPGVVISRSVVSRKGNSETYQPSFKDPLHAGTEFELVEVRGEWYHIQLADGRRCWIPEKSAELVR